MTRRWAFWLLVAVTLALYLALVIWSLPLIARDAGGLRPFDLRPLGYSFAEAQAFLTALGETGLAQYQGAQRWLDLAFPALLALMLIACFARLFARAWAMALSVVAVLGAVFDYLENRAVAGMLRLGPGGIDEEIVMISSAWTMLKSAAVSLAGIAVVMGMVLAIRRRWA